MYKSIIILSLLSLTSPAMADQIVSLPQENLPWAVTPEGAEFAALEGDRFREPYMAMVRLPAGLASPVHIKSANMFGVVMEGVFIHTKDNETVSDATRLGPGSYYHIPAGVSHVSACVSKEPCVAFLYQDGAFDFNVVQD